MKLQLFSTGKELPPQAHPLFADLASCGFPSPAADYVESDLDLHDYCIRHPERDVLPACQRETAWPTVCTMAICWLWTVLKSRGTAISLSPACGGVYGETASADAATDAAAHECLLVADLS